jgi:hypothetical protein
MVKMESEQFCQRVQTSDSNEVMAATSGATCMQLGAINVITNTNRCGNEFHFEMGATVFMFNAEISDNQIIINFA